MSDKTIEPVFQTIHNGSTLPGERGMPLRDWFAGMAMQGLLADSSIHGTHAEIANNAYGFADAMLKARETK